MKIPCLLLCAACTLTGCEPSGGKPPPPSSAAAAVQPAEHRFPLRVGAAELSARVALHPGEMARGLMKYAELGTEEGMVFVYEKPQRMRFYMRSTPVALDIGFFTRDGVLREVYPMFPYDEAVLESRREDLCFALEVPQGWFARHRLKPGERMDLPLLAAAVQARGVVPATRGL